MVILISERLCNLIHLLHSILLIVTLLYHMFWLRLLHSLTLYDCRLLLVVALWYARHDQTSVAALCRTWRHAHHGAGSSDGHLGWQSSNSEENVHVVGIENLREITVHFIYLNISKRGDDYNLTFIS